MDAVATKAPGRGYWIKKEFGKPVEHLPLPEAKDLPVVMRFKESPVEGSPIEQPPLPEAEPTDEYYKSIVEIESRTIPFQPNAKKNQLTATAEKILSRGD